MLREWFRVFCLAGCILTTVLVGISKAQDSDVATEKTGEAVKALMAKHAKARLTLMELRAKELNSNEELQAIVKQIDRLYAELHENLMNNPDIAAAAREVAELEKELELKRAGRESSSETNQESGN